MRLLKTVTMGVIVIIGKPYRSVTPGQDGKEKWEPGGQTGSGTVKGESSNPNERNIPTKIE